MEFVDWMLMGVSLAAIGFGRLLVGWFAGRHLNERFAEQLSRSAALERECSTLR
ncbi:MAG: hypothetical protein J7549_06510 [Variovorax sp.]|nr:hypothetical protein [Variovorax sp.]